MIRWIPLYPAGSHRLIPARGICRVIQYYFLRIRGKCKYVRKNDFLTCVYYEIFFSIETVFRCGNIVEIYILLAEELFHITKVGLLSRKLRNFQQKFKNISSKYQNIINYEVMTECGILNACQVTRRYQVLALENHRLGIMGYTQKTHLLDGLRNW